jgi:hypothetical protein
LWTRNCLLRNRILQITPERRTIYFGLDSGRCFENSLIQSHRDRAGSRFEIAIRKARMPTTNATPIPNNTIVASSDFHAPSEVLRVPSWRLPDLARISKNSLGFEESLIFKIFSSSLFIFLIFSFFSSFIMIIASYCGRRGLDGRIFAISCGKENPRVPYIVILIDTTALSQVKNRHILIFPAEKPQNFGLTFSEAGGRISESSGADGSR